MSDIYRRRRFAVVATFIVLTIGVLIAATQTIPGPAATEQTTQNVTQSTTDGILASDILRTIAVKGRAPKTDYSRDQFGQGWSVALGCDTRNIILNRDLTNVQLDEKCNVIQGVLADPYTGKSINFVRGAGTSDDVQIDHVVALSDAWQTGAQLLSKQVRIQMANDPLELLAVDGPANQQKSDGDAATWLPPYKAFRCQYVARQIAVKQKYSLWMTQAEYDAIDALLQSCPSQRLPTK